MLCPISLLYYPIESIAAGYLTIVHIPLQSLGGKGLLLISKAINNKDGYTSDKKILKYFEDENSKRHNGQKNITISSDAYGPIVKYLKNNEPRMNFRSSI